MPYVEPPYPLPDADLYTPPSVGRIAAGAAGAPLGALRTDLLHGDSIVRRYWAALWAAADARAHPPVAVPAPQVVIPQADTLSVHHEPPADNPFERLIESSLHVHLPHEEQPEA